MGEQLKLKTEITADVTISIDGTAMSMENCVIYANDPHEQDILFIAHDTQNENRKIQVRVKKK